MKADTCDYHQLFLQDTPLLDVRAPVEFSRGAFASATNIPLLDDRQRELVGICYKKSGEAAAIALGLELASDEIREQRLLAWLDFCRRNPDGYLYCFRGGLRSRTTQQWIREQGVDYPLVQGGYKAMRRYLIDELESNLQRLPMVCVSGLTGVGKTRLLLKISRHIDFEGLANHRGSAFGRNPADTQPSSIDWENAVSVAFLKHAFSHAHKPLFVEDEGRRIGRVTMPDNLYAALLKAPRAILRLDLESRIRLIAEEYIQQNWPAYQQSYADNAEQEFSFFVLDNLARIQKRLGGDRYKRVHKSFELGLQRLFADGTADGFDPGIQLLLEEYYDPMYRYQIGKKQVEIIFEGEQEEFLQWAEDYCSQPSSELNRDREIQCGQ